ncbi:MAG: aspartate dehydrogenase [Clostridiales bacterium]|nr:aspartate dehydrogenase [Clostridiales bacterium]
MFGKKSQKKEQKKSYDPQRKTPMMKCSICNGEKVAGFKDVETGNFEEVMFIRNDADLNEFRRMYGIGRDEEIAKVY